MLARLDRVVEVRAQAGEDMLAQVIAGDWDGFLSLFDAAGVEPGVDGESGGHNAALALWLAGRDNRANPVATLWKDSPIRSEEHTSELQSLMRISYAGFCLKK